MRSANKTRYAILGMLLDGPSSGYEIQSLMRRSTVYFWRESDSTIYPTLKVLANEGKVLFETVPVGKKRKEVFSITETGREEVKAWLESPTGSETPRNEFLLKLFFITEQEEMIRLFRERLAGAEKTYEEFKNIVERIESVADSPRKAIRLKMLRHGMAHIALEMKWLREEIGLYAS